MNLTDAEFTHTFFYGAKKFVKLIDGKRVRGVRLAVSGTGKRTLEHLALGQCPLALVAEVQGADEQSAPADSGFKYQPQPVTLVEVVDHVDRTGNPCMVCGSMRSIPVAGPGSRSSPASNPERRSLGLLPRRCITCSKRRKR